MSSGTEKHGESARAMLEAMEAKRGRLLARAGPDATGPDAAGSTATGPAAAPAPPGTHPLDLATEGRRDGFLVVPSAAEAGQPLPLLLLLHGAGGNAAGMLRMFEEAAEAAGIALLVPDSRGASWDVIRGGLGPDVAFIDAALRRAFARLPVDPARLGIGGFSDGASYALTLGLANGELFRWVLAFSPGFAAPPETRGAPRLYVSHGTEDEVLPVDRCSRRLVARLRRAGYDLSYDEFEGGHVVPPRAMAQGLALLRGG